MKAEEFFEQKYGNKITANDSWVIRFAEEYANQDKWISVEDSLPEIRTERYRCIAEVHARRQTFYKDNYTIVQDWVIRRTPQNFIKWKELI